MSVAHKNPFDLLGNDGDSDTPSGPVKTVDKKSTRTAKGGADGEAPARGALASSTRRGGYSGSEAAFRDRGAGSDRNHGKSTEDGARGGSRGGHTARVRGGRGSRFPRDRDDRHNKGAPGGGSDKQAAHGWGGTEGDAELKDETAAEEIAKKDETEAATEEAAEGGEARDEPAEPEEKQVSYSEYLAQQAEKKLALEGDLQPRRANEGVKKNKQWDTATPLVKEEDEFISGTSGKAKRERERKTKQLVDIDNRYHEPERGGRGGAGGRGGRGGGERGRGEFSRGGGERGRGDFSRGGGERGRGDFSRGGPRGGRGGPRGDFRGDFRGGRGGGERGGGERGGGERGASHSGGGGRINTSDEKAFPSLGS